jgi:hypothetical protein
VPDAPPIDVNLLRPALAAGLTWLYETEQPTDGVQHHLGVTVYSDAVNRSVSLVPSGLGGAAAGLPVIVVEVVHKVYRWPAALDDRCWELANGYTEGELQRIADVVRDLGRDVIETWNGRPRSDSGSIALADPAGPSIVPVHNYLRGCPTHHTVFCSHDGCTWYRDGHARVVMPTPPEGVRCSG